ncbi:MAG: YifB family Mg chelatase-like AAA ATPase [Candidatus Sumerlaeia bacterium]|nr:YifB family Mg chelatase-like AAA ATPase [Candidatus Sumerlaeia bacterium]
MHASLLSYSVLGIDAVPITVEVDAINSNSVDTTHWIIVGMGDTAIRESRERIKGALRNCGVSVGQKRITINLAPADLKKEGAHLDLSMALATLVGTGHLSAAAAARFVAVGELGLGGEIRAIPGALSIALGARQQGAEGLILPAENAREAAVVTGLPVYAVSNLREVIRFLKGDLVLSPTLPDAAPDSQAAGEGESLDFADVRGQESVKRALEIACAGNHNVILVGSPGSGKTMLAKRLPGILPGMTFDESMETTKIYSIAGLLTRNQGLVRHRPFRSPHHTASSVALIGGGTTPRPGEVSLAHNGVLFLDEFPEFSRNVLEVLRQPLEDNTVCISRAQMTLSFPANFLLCATMNPCPCGYSGHPTKPCYCRPQNIQRYVSRISGPLMDRIDLHVHVPAVKVEDLQKQRSGESSVQIRERVQRAREIQTARFSTVPHMHCNAQMGTRELDEYCQLSMSSRRLLKSAMEGLNLSARAYARILKIARTIADLDGRDVIGPEQLSEAIQYRTLDRGGAMAEVA